MTETARRLRRLGAPHARARALAAVLTGAGAALAVAAAGLRLAPRATGVVLAWVLILAVTAGALLLATRAARAVADRVVGRLVERHAGARAGSVVGLLAPAAGGSADLLAAADARAAGVVGAAGAAGRRLGPLEHDLFLRASTGGRRSTELHVAVALPAFLAALEITARFPAYLDRPDEPFVTGAGVDTVTIPEGTTLVARGAASVPLRGAAWTAGHAAVAMRTDGTAFTGSLTPTANSTWRLDLAPTDGSAREGDAVMLAARVTP